MDALWSRYGSLCCIVLREAGSTLASFISTIVCQASSGYRSTCTTRQTDVSAA